MNSWSLFWTEVIAYQPETSNPTKTKIQTVHILGRV